MSQDKTLIPVSATESPNNYSIVWSSGAGKIPVSLQGLWTLRAALVAIESYNLKSK